MAKVTAGQPLVLQFFLTNTYPHGVKKNVTVRDFVVREEKIGQKEVPSLKDGTVTDGNSRCHSSPPAGSALKCNSTSISQETTAPSRNAKHRQRSRAFFGAGYTREEGFLNGRWRPCCCCELVTVGSLRQACLFSVPVIQVFMNCLRGRFVFSILDILRGFRRSRNAD